MTRNRGTTAHRAGFVAGALAFALGTTVVSISGRNLQDQPGRIDDPIPGKIQQGRISAQLQGLAYGSGITAPLYGTFAPGPGPTPGATTTQPNILYVVDQDGPLWAVDVRNGAKRLFINTRTQRPLMPLGASGPGTFDERGFLGVAFHPNYQVPGPEFGLFYTYTSELPGTNADLPPEDHFNVVTEWRSLDPLTPPAVRPASRRDGSGSSDEPPPEEADPPLAVPVREVVRIGWPQFNHNGGAIFFGTRVDDRLLLHVTTGDGGSADDQNLQTTFRFVPTFGHGTGSEATAPNRNGNGQNPLSAWGKLFRFDPRTVNEVVIPAGDNVPGAPLTVHAYGLRNPWRASSDRVDLGGTGDIWIGDVGQNDLEEVDRISQGAARPTLCGAPDQTPRPFPNFGWHLKEGTFLFNPFLYELFDPPSDGFVFANSPCTPPDMVDPIAQYDHDEGTAVIGGFVYRGPDPELSELRGRYVFGDWSRRFLNGNGQVFWLDEKHNCDPKDCTPRIFYLTNGPLNGNTFLLGFGEDAKGNLYALANETGIPFKETGLVLKLVKECADDAPYNGFADQSPTCRD